jgi:hypothetical protein
MFAHEDRVPRTITCLHPTGRRARVALWTAWSLVAPLALAVASTLGLVASRVAFGREPIGGSSGLLVLYLATAGIGVGAAALVQILAAARRAAGSAGPGPLDVSVARDAVEHEEPSSWAA